MHYSHHPKSFVPESPLRWDRRALACAGVGTLLLIAAGLSENEILLVLGLFLSGTAGLMLVLPVLEDFAAHFNPLRILAGSTLGAYGLGGTIAWVFAQDDVVGGFPVVLLHYQISVSDLALAQIAAVMFGLLLLAIVRAPAGNETEQRFALSLAAALRDSSSDWLLVRAAIGISVLQASFLILGVVGYRSITTSDVVNPAALILVTISPISPFFTGVLIGRVQAGYSRSGILLLSIALGMVNAFWFFAQGRVAFLFACALGLVGYAATRPANLRSSLVKSALIFGPLIGLVFVASQQIRFFQWVEESQKINVFSALQLSVTEGSKLGEAERLESRSNNRINLAMRPLTLNYPAEMIHLRRNGGAGWVGFEEVWNSVLVALPRQIYPDKSGIALAERLFSVRLGTAGTDNAETILVSAIAGFSYLGLPIFAVLMWMIVKAISGLLLLSRSWLLMALGAVTLLLLGMAGGEGPFVSWVVNMRSVALAAPFVIALNAWLQPGTAGAASGSPGVRRFVGMPRKS
jgi:hypothetical protein